MKPTAKTYRRCEGDFLKVGFDDNLHSYAQVATEPLLVFFDGAYAQDVGSDEIAQLPILFRIWVANHAVTRGRWPIIGRDALTSANKEEPFFYKQDALTGRLALYHSTFAASGWERPATLVECAGLESAAIWEPEHVEDRLRDHYAGKPNKWVEGLRIDTAAIP